MLAGGLALIVLVGRLSHTGGAGFSPARSRIAIIPAVHRQSMPPTPPDANDPRPLLRRIVATLAYRAAKVLRDAPPEFGLMQAGSITVVRHRSSRTLETS